jgi:Ca-activated chloride channel homolog
VQSSKDGSAAGTSRTQPAPQAQESAARKIAKQILGGTPTAVGLVVAAVVGTAIGNLLTRYVLYSLLALAAFALAVLGLYYGDNVRRSLRRAQPRKKVVAWRTRGRIMAVICALGGCGYFLGYWVLGHGFARGAWVGIGYLLVILAAVAAVLAVVRWRRGSWPGWLRRRARTGLACLMVAAGLSAGGTVGRADLAPPCPAPAELRVLTSSDDLGAVQAAIPGFEQYEPAHRGTGCYVVDVTAYAAPSDRAAWSGLAAGWGPAELGSDGPRPDIWIPGSSAEVAQVAGAPGGPGLHRLGSMASSPLVVAVPDELVGKHSLADLEQDASWPGLHDRLRGEGIGLAMPNPELSETARLQIAGLYPALNPADRRVIAASGSFPPDGGNLLCDAAQAAEQGTSQPATGYLVPEAALINGNAGQLTEGACATLTAEPSPLTAFYPSGGAALDFPFTIVSWGSGGETARGQYEADFYHWLTSGAARGTLEAWGLRPPGCGTLAHPPPGIAAAIPGCPGGNRPASTEVTSALQGFRTAQARVQVHILVGIDSSGPMEPYLPRITAAVDAELGPGGTHIGGGDSFGIWALPGRDGQTERQLVRFGPAAAAGRRVIAGLGVLAGRGHSANYDMLADAAALLYGQPAAGPEPINSVVLLTDGDGYPAGDPHGHDPITMAGAFDRPPSGHSAIRLFIIAFGPVGCAESAPGSPSLAALANATGGICLQADGTNPRPLLAQVLSQISAGQ